MQPLSPLLVAIDGYTHALHTACAPVFTELARLGDANGLVVLDLYIDPDNTVLPTLDMMLALDPSSPLRTDTYCLHKPVDLPVMHQSAGLALLHLAALGEDLIALVETWQSKTGFDDPGHFVRLFLDREGGAVLMTEYLESWLERHAPNPLYPPATPDLLAGVRSYLVNAFSAHSLVDLLPALERFHHRLEAMDLDIGSSDGLLVSPPTNHYFLP